MKKKRTHWWIIENRATGIIDPSYGIFNCRREARNHLRRYSAAYAFRVIKVVEEQAK